MQLAMSESMSDESMMGSGGETLDGRQRADARDLIATPAATSHGCCQEQLENRKVIVLFAGVRFTSLLQTDTYQTRYCS